MQDVVTASYPSGAAVDDVLKDAMVASADKTVPMYDAKGNPIQYANISSAYWQEHFMAFGRIQ